MQIYPLNNSVAPGSVPPHEHAQNKTPRGRIYVKMCMCICACVYIYMYMHVYMYIHTMRVDSSNKTVWRLVACPRMNMHSTRRLYAYTYMHAHIQVYAYRSTCDNRA